MKVRVCKKCLNISFRPRLTFNSEGVCNACQWAETKTSDWKEKRWNKLEEICNKYRSKDGSNWDVIVPCSGGKDGSYVAWRMKYDLNMHPLCVTVMPMIQTEPGRLNLENFKKAGFDHMAITPDFKIYSRFSRKCFKEQGRPKVPFEVAISTVTIKIAMAFNIPLIMYGEEGESEYGGAMTQAHKPKIDREYLVKYYYSGYDTTSYLNEFTKADLKWWLLPSQEEFDQIDLFPTHWSHYENWDGALHAKLAKEKCGHQGYKHLQVGTFTSSYGIDDYINDLHHYMKFIKFGFGKASSDATLEIRAGRMNREEGVEMVKKYDGKFDEERLQHYLTYLDMPESEFFKTIDSYANRNALEKINGRWQLKAAAIKGIEKGGEFEV